MTSRPSEHLIERASRRQGRCTGDGRPTSALVGATVSAPGLACGRLPRHPCRTPRHSSPHPVDPGRARPHRLARRPHPARTVSRGPRLRAAAAAGRLRAGRGGTRGPLWRARPGDRRRAARRRVHRCARRRRSHHTVVAQRIAHHTPAAASLGGTRPPRADRRCRRLAGDGTHRRCVRRSRLCRRSMRTERRRHRPRRRALPTV